MKMKQITLSMAGVLAAIAFAPEASAVPVFARQTGMACSACHFAHFPLLNPFGRSFKASGYTLMGSQGQVEGEDLAIPDRLNIAVLATAGHTSVSDAANNTKPVAGDNGWFVPGAGGELNMFFGGKVTEMSGFLSEFGMGGSAIGGASGKLLILPEVADGIHAGLAFYQIGQGPAGSFEMMSTGATSIHRLMGNTGFASAGAGHAQGEHIVAYSARQFVAPEVGSTGVSAIVVADSWFVNLSRYAVLDGAAGVSSAQNLPGQYVRVAGFFDIAGFDSGVGIQNWSGTQNVNAAVGGVATVAQLGEQRATVVDFQMQGEVGGSTLGIYASYGKAPKGTAALANINNASTTQDITSFNIAADYTVMPKVTLQAAIRSANVPNLLGTAKEGDNATMVGLAYELAMNQHLSFHYTANSGSAWSATGVNSGNVGKTSSTFLLESFF
jgi:hypothetical protein